MLWYNFLCKNPLKIARSSRGDRPSLMRRSLARVHEYTSWDYWKVVVYKVFKGISTREASDELNDELHKRYRKNHARMDGKYPRHKRLVSIGEIYR